MKDRVAELEQQIQKIHDAESEAYESGWGGLLFEVPEEISKKLDEKWESIKEQYPTFDPTMVLSSLNEIYDIAGEHATSEMRCTSFSRMSDFYDITYDVMYKIWLNG